MLDYCNSVGNLVRFIAAVRRIVVLFRIINIWELKSTDLLTHLNYCQGFIGVAKLVMVVIIGIARIFRVVIAIAMEAREEDSPNFEPIKAVESV